MGPPPAKRRKFKPKPVKPGGVEDTLVRDVRNLNYPAPSEAPRPERFSQVTVDVRALSASGDGIGIEQASGHVVVAPFCLPGDTIQAKVYNDANPVYLLADFVSVDKASTDRSDDLIGCKYFGTCSGCQFQMLAYQKQLSHKKNVIENAYRNFSTLNESNEVPAVDHTQPSPLEYGYRTKITPHFDRPKKSQEGKNLPVAIGFTKKGQKHIVDIEECPISTAAINNELGPARKRVLDNIDNYKNGATLLLRESTRRDGEPQADEKSVETDHKKIITEFVGDFKFESPAGTFFQNNNSILPSLVEYVRTQLAANTGSSGTQKPKYMVDAYCGSGLFTVTCSRSFLRSVGVEISADSVHYAARNCEANNIKNAQFITGQAEKIFAGLELPGSETCMVIDPPRKGCDELFLTQLLSFAPLRIVYVSCNVHTQARDIEYIIRESSKLCRKYVLDAIKGFDLFPQTHHVESIATLTLSQ